MSSCHIIYSYCKKSISNNVPINFLILLSQTAKNTELKLFVYYYISIDLVLENNMIIIDNNNIDIFKVIIF